MYEYIRYRAFDAYTDFLLLLIQELSLFTAILLSCGRGVIVAWLEG